MIDSKLFITPIKSLRPNLEKALGEKSDPTLDEDTSLILRFQKGDETAFEILVDKFKGPVFRYVWRQVGSLNDAEEIAQNVFVQVYKSAPRYEPRAKFTTWLFTIARNLCLNEFRRRHRHPVQSLEETFHDDTTEEIQIEDQKAGNPSHQITEIELQEKIDAAIQSLPENQKTALILCRYENLSYQEIARILKTSESATKSLIHRAREALKQKLSEYLRET